MRTVTIPYADPYMQRLAEWTAKMLDAAETTAARIGCSPAAVVAQAALESGWGTASIDNNVFGIKPGLVWTGPVQSVTTREWSPERGYYTIRDDFRVYPTLEAGVQDHFDFFMGNSRYKNVFDPDGTMSDERYLSLVAEDGYATDPNYASVLIDTLQTVRSIERHISVGSNPLPVTPRLLLIYCSGPDVETLQRQLADLHYYSGEIDGGYGPITSGAIRRFQADHELEVDGVVGPKTRAALAAQET